MKATIEGIEIEADNKTGRIYWMSDWGKVYELLNVGKLTHKFYKNLFGHTDFYLKGANYEESR